MNPKDHPDPFSYAGYPKPEEGICPKCGLDRQRRDFERCAWCPPEQVTKPLPER